MRQPKKEWNNTEIEIARKMWADGKSLNAIGRALGENGKNVGYMMQKRRDIFAYRVKRATPTPQQDSLLQEISFETPSNITAEFVKEHFPQFSLGAIRERVSKIRSSRMATIRLREARNARLKAHRMMIRPNGCQKLIDGQRCNSHTVGKFCEAHVREEFKRDMTPVKIARYA